IYYSFTVFLKNWYFVFVLLNSRICLGRFLSSTAHQFLRFERRRLTNLGKYAILTAEEKTRHRVNRLVA
ncbi:MAG: hypothetical protein IJ009_05740, partial [Clostridia bacterium]|nr:hypothetical protein [Clostridia bacterium]